MSDIILSARQIVPAFFRLISFDDVSWQFKQTENTQQIEIDLPLPKYLEQKQQLVGGALIRERPSINYLKNYRVEQTNTLANNELLSFITFTPPRAFTIDGAEKCLRFVELVEGHIANSKTITMQEKLRTKLARLKQDMGILDTKKPPVVEEQSSLFGDMVKTGSDDKGPAR